MPMTAARSPLTPGRRRGAVALGAVFVGSSLVAVMSSPVHAEPSPSSSASPTDSPSPEPVPSAELTLETDSSEVELGESVPPNPLTATNNGDASICLLGLEVNAPEFTSQGFEPQEVAPGTSTSAGEVTGAPRSTAEVVATLTYALAEEDVDCAALAPAERHTVATGTWTVSVTEPSPTPTPTPTPTPSPTPTPTPTDDEEGESPSPTSPPDDGDGRTDGSDGSGDSGESSPPREPGGGVDEVPTSDVPTSDFPDLPSDEADLPGVSPGSEDLAELPTVTPGEDGDVDGTEVAADHSGLGPNMAPAVLLAAFLLALLLATPLAPVRRVRIGGGYQGKRRRK